MNIITKSRIVLEKRGKQKPVHNLLYYSKVFNQNQRETYSHQTYTQAHVNIHFD